MKSKIIAAALLAIAGAAAHAQQASPFGSFSHDRTQPIEITADSLAVDQANETATFEGDVVAGQGTLRLTAETVVVNYGGDGETGEIERMEATGSVFLSNGAETAEGQRAIYDVAAGTVLMTGDVVLTQGENAISGQELTIDLNGGQGRISGGRVKSVFTPSSQNQ